MTGVDTRVHGSACEWAMVVKKTPMLAQILDYSEVLPERGQSVILIFYNNYEWFEE